jgi:hypothetical protein
MHQINPKHLDRDPSDRSAAADVLVRQEQDEDEEEHDGGEEDDMIAGNRFAGRYIVVFVVLVLVSFITVLVWVRKHRTRERRTTIPLSSIIRTTRNQQMIRWQMGA